MLVLCCGIVGGIELSVNVIVAHDEHLGIGYEGQLPWRGQVPADMERFKRLTMGKLVVMGRKTYESIGHPLAGRENIVVSRNPDLTIDGVEVVNSLEAALELRNEGQELFIAGGATIYQLAMPHADKLYITRIQEQFEADTFFVSINEDEWRLIDSSRINSDADNRYDMEFETYERI